MEAHNERHRPAGVSGHRALPRMGAGGFGESANAVLDGMVDASTTRASTKIKVVDEGERKHVALWYLSGGDAVSCDLHRAAEG